MVGRIHNLSDVARTSLGTLSTRAKNGDKLAIKFYNSILHTIDKNGMKNFNFKPALIRTGLFDQAVQTFIDENSHGHILNLGCGFCSRYERLKNTTISWTEVDKDEIIKIRKEIYPETDKYKYLIHDLNNPLSYDNYDLIVAEGVLCYLDINKAKEIVRGNMIFDVLGNKRTVPLGPDQKWTFKIDDWQHLNISNLWEYGAENRDDRIYQIEGHK